MAKWQVRTMRSGIMGGGELMLSIKSLVQLRNALRDEGNEAEAKFVNNLIVQAYENDART